MDRWTGRQPGKTIRVIPRLHLVTNDEVLGTPGFLDRARTAIAAGREDLVLHLRTRETPTRDLLNLADALYPDCIGCGASLSINDRVDIALAVGADWAHLGSDSMPASAARAVLGPESILGASVHSAEGLTALAADVDYVIAGHVYETASHPEIQGKGLDLVQAVANAVGARVVEGHLQSGRGPLSPPEEGARPSRAFCRVIAIGGISVERVAGVIEARADGIAVLSGVWGAGDPGEAVTRYLQALEEAR